MSEERKKSKRAGLLESQSGIRLGKLTIWVSSFESKAVLMMDVKSPKIKALEDGLIEKTSSMLDEIESKAMHKNEEGDW